MEKQSREFVFLQSQTNFIEKNLGVAEKIKVRPECVVAFSPTVSFQREVVNGLFNAYFNVQEKFVTVTGPGLIYIDMQVGSRFFRKSQFSVFFITFYLILYFAVFLITVFDRF